MKFAYVLVSDDYDIYYEQFLVSLISLRHWNPDATVSVVCDDATEKNLVGMRSRHVNMVDEMKVIHFDAGRGKHFRSRFLKTTLRNTLDGDFLYLDSDTIVCDRIEESEFDGDVMGVDDKHQLLENHSLRDWIVEVIRKAGFDETGICHYINGGVLWMKESAKAHEFSSRWFSLWNVSAEKDVAIDQPSLNEVNKQMGNVVSILPGVYNCQVSATLGYLHNAKIIHCFATMISDYSYHGSAFLFLNDTFYKDIKNREITLNDECLIYNAKSAFDEGETILLSKRDSDIYRALNKTNLYGFIYCLFNSKRGRWLFDLMDKVVCLITSFFWKK